MFATEFCLRLVKKCFAISIRLKPDHQGSAIIIIGEQGVKVGGASLLYATNGD